MAVRKSNMRYERKYQIDSHDYYRVYDLIMANPTGFQRSYADRKVNSIYYDDINYSSYNDNLVGVANRVKYRVRWYGDVLDQINNPILEKKIKTGLLGTKEYLQIEDFNLQSNAPDINERNLITNALTPTVVVRYDRTYFESFNKRIRATIDRNLEYGVISNGKLFGSFYADPRIILEVKYDQENEDEAQDCLQFISYRLSKNSKYIAAMSYYV